MMPVPPDFVINIVAPHLGVEIKTFWLSSFLGVISMTLIHTAIGEELSDMSSSSDFHLFSLKNMLIILVVGIAMVVPVLVKRYVQPPEDPESTHGPIHLDDAPEPAARTWRERARSGVQRLLTMIHPSWRSSNRAVDAVRIDDAYGSDGEFGDESISAWRTVTRDTHATGRALETMPSLATDDAFNSDESDVEDERGVHSMFDAPTASPSNWPARAAHYAQHSAQFADHAPNAARRLLQRLGVSL